MTTATPLSLPLVLDQKDHASTSHLNRRRWKPDRPNYRAILTANHSRGSSDDPAHSTSSRKQNVPKSSASHADLDQLEADLQEWGLPSISTNAKLAAPTSALSWDENSTQASCSYLQSQNAAKQNIAASLDQWDPSISFAPFSSSCLDPVDLSASSHQPITYNPSLGRIVAVGRDDGTVSIYRAYGRLEDYESLSSGRDPQLKDADDSLPASASASTNLSNLNHFASRRSSIISDASRLRSPEVETPSIRFPSSTASKSNSSSGREPSPLLPTFPHVDRSSFATRSIISTASVSSTVAANVQIDEGLPANSLQSNVNATGHTAGRTFGEQAEDRLELQMAAAERNDHQHGVVGGVIERLGFSSHSHSQSHSHSPSPQLRSSREHSRHLSSHRMHPSESRQSLVTPPTETLATMTEHSTVEAVAHESALPTHLDTSLQPSASDAWLHDPSRGSFSQLMTLYTRDRSPVVALRLFPLPVRAEDRQEAFVSSATAQPSLDKTALLVVQEAGNVSMWSILEGAMLWQSDVTVATVASIDAGSADMAGKESSLSLGVMHSLSRQLPAAIGTPLARSPAGSARASPRPPMVSAGDASIRRSMLRAALSGPDSSTASRLRETHGVKLSASVQTFEIISVPLAMVWDSHSMSALVIGLLDGRLLLHEALDDVSSANTPAIRLAADAQDRLELVWFSDTEHKLQTQSVRIVMSEVKSNSAAGVAQSQVKHLQGFALDAKAENDSAANDSWTLSGEDAQAEQIHFATNRVVVQSPARLSVLNAADGEAYFIQDATVCRIKSICGSSRDAQHLFVQTRTGLARLDLSATQLRRVEQQQAEPAPGKASFTLLANHPSSGLSLAWSLPVKGELLDKLFLIQPLGTDTSSTAAATETSASNELVAFDLSTGQIEDVLVSSKSDATSTNGQAQVGADRITALLPLSLERIAVASSGGIQILSLLSMAASATNSSPQTKDGTLDPSAAIENSLGADHEICLLRAAVAPRSGQRLIIGGTLQGEVGFWQANAATTPTTAPQLEAVLSISTTPVEALVVFGDDDNTIRLHGCVACICADSSVTVVLLEGFRLLYTVPGRGARLTSLAVRADELLLTYDDDKARVWDLRTQELRRSIATDQAQALVEDGRGWWTIKSVEPFDPLHSGTTGVLSQLASARDGAAASLLVDFRRAIEAAARAIRGAGQSGSKDDAVPRSGTQAATLRFEQDYDRNTGPASVGLGSPAARKAVNIIRPLLPTVFPTGLDADMDAKLAALLDLEELISSHRGNSTLGVGLYSAPDALMVGRPDAESDAKKAWKLSSRLTTTRLMVASALLRVLSHVSELHALAEDLQRFVEDVSRLSSLVGVGFRGVALNELVPYWLDTNSELQSASRSMFQIALARLEQEQLDEICNQWQYLLSPARTAAQTTKARTESSKPAAASIEEAELRARALALVGSIAVERYTSLSPRTLKDIATTVHGAIVSDRGSEVRTAQELQMLAVAIELCRGGFSMWQHYFDATEVVRSLFALSTSSTSSNSSSNNADAELRTLARAATLQIAAENTPLFMTTLSLDILHARSPAHCSATMRLVAFMVRKRPSVLVANLPRLAEAVVKSLDPTHTTMREAVVNAATVMISELVSTYPSVNFFGAGQRLAVGTHEGAVIMYDLKTATRLYVLEGHRRRADAVSFSPDGRRLVTMSLEEGRVLVWKTSSGFSSFFSPGQMPRQGATDAKLTDGAYKAFLFNVGDQQQSFAGSRPASMLVEAETRIEGQEEEFVGFDRIGFHWNSERSVKVAIGEAQLNISVD